MLGDSSQKTFSGGYQVCMEVIVEYTLVNHIFRRSYVKCFQLAGSSWLSILNPFRLGFLYSQGRTGAISGHLRALWMHYLPRHLGKIISQESPNRQYFGVTICKRGTTGKLNSPKYRIY